jgi:hypothetical protein
MNSEDIKSLIDANATLAAHNSALQKVIMNQGIEHQRELDNVRKLLYMIINKYGDSNEVRIEDFRLIDFDFYKWTLLFYRDNCTLDTVYKIIKEKNSGQRI